MYALSYCLLEFAIIIVYYLTRSHAKDQAFGHTMFSFALKFLFYGFPLDESGRAKFRLNWFREVRERCNASWGGNWCDRRYFQILLIEVTTSSRFGCLRGYLAPEYDGARLLRTSCKLEPTMRSRRTGDSSPANAKDKGQ